MRELPIAIEEKLVDEEVVDELVEVEVLGQL